MCFSSDSSIFTFIFGIISSILLFYFGNKKYNKENIVFGLYFIYVSFMQLFDYLFWNDLNNKNKINEKITLIAPLFNYTQPLFLFIVKIIIYKNFTLSIFSILNFLYLILVFIYYNQFLQNEKNKITKKKENHLYWPWKKYLNIYIYLIITIINVFYLTNIKYSFIIFILGIISLLISHYYIKYSVGELWCFFVILIPLIMIPISYLI